MLDVEEDENGRKVIWTTKKDIAENCFFLKGKKFSLDGYPPMHAIYNSAAKFSVICSGRQVGKCAPGHGEVTLSDGSTKLLRDVVAGDAVRALDEATFTFTARDVLDAYYVGDRPCLRFRLQLGADLEVAETHPIRTATGYRLARDLQPNDALVIDDRGVVGYDRVVAIAPMGVLPCYDLTVDVDHNYVLDRVVVHNSTSAANFMVAECIGNPHWESIGVLPSIMQMRRFSNQRVAKVISDSPIIKKWFQNAQCKKNTMERGLINGSMMYFGALSQVESLRGLSANRILEDEVQDMVSDDLPIVEEALSGQTSDKQFILRTGTAKTVGNLLESTFRDSTMCEWIVVCPAGHHNVPSAENVGDKGFTCKKCRSVCDVRMGYWMAMADHPNEKKWVGFRVPQIILPLHTEDPEKWTEIVRKRHGGVDKITFTNEVMGHAAGSGIDFLSEDDLRACCEPYECFEIEPPRNETYYTRIATVDWGLTAKRSYTILSIWGLLPTGRLKLLYCHRYLEADIFKQVDDIAMKCINFGVEVVGADWGAGFAQAVLLEQKIRRRVIRFMYVTEQRELAKYDSNATLFKINRTQAMTETFLQMKKKWFMFPQWDRFKHFAKDILCIFMEPLDDKRTMNDKFKYDHPEDAPDDFAHTCVYANLLIKLMRESRL